jgi:hypothetical protein
MDLLALKYFELINEFLEKDGYKNTLKARELRSFKWEKDKSIVTLVMNHSVTEFKLTYTA